MRGDETWVKQNGESTTSFAAPDLRPAIAYIYRWYRMTTDYVDRYAHALLPMNFNRNHQADKPSMK